MRDSITQLADSTDTVRDRTEQTRFCDCIYTKRAQQTDNNICTTHVDCFRPFAVGFGELRPIGVRSRTRTPARSPVPRKSVFLRPENNGNIYKYRLLRLFFEIRSDFAGNGGQDCRQGMSLKRGLNKSYETTFHGL